MGDPADGEPAQRDEYTLAYEPELLPPLALMRTEGIDVLEEWLRWAEEWSVLLRVYGPLRRDGAMLEIGCGLGRVAFALRYLLSERGSYDGFEIVRAKVDFLAAFTRAHPNFRFAWADVCNTYYNPSGTTRAEDYRFPYEDGCFDVVFAASVFTHMLPPAMAHYLAESARVLRPGGRCVFSFFLLDHYDPRRPRPHGFAREAFAFDHAWGDHGDGFAIGVPENPEEMTAYSRALIERTARAAGLRIADSGIVPGLWSGAATAPVGAQDVVVLEKSPGSAGALERLRGSVARRTRPRTA